MDFLKLYTSFQGDSGGPAFKYQLNGQRMEAVLLGVVGSTAKDCSTIKVAPTLLSNVAFHRNWIEKKMKIWIFKILLQLFWTVTVWSFKFCNCNEGKFVNFDQHLQYSKCNLFCILSALFPTRKNIYFEKKWLQFLDFSWVEHEYWE